MKAGYRSHNNGRFRRGQDHAFVEIEAGLRPVHHRNVLGVGAEVGVGAHSGLGSIANTLNFVEQRRMRPKGGDRQSGRRFPPGDSLMAFDGDSLAERPKGGAHSVFLVALL